jgi:hypothetical protein
MKKQDSKRIDYEIIRAIKKLPYLAPSPDNEKQLEMEYYHLLHGNKGLSIRTVLMEKHILEWIQKSTNVSRNKIFELFIICYYSMKFTDKLYSHKTIEKRIDRLNSAPFQKKINRIIELENQLF